MSDRLERVTGELLATLVIVVLVLLVSARCGNDRDDQGHGVVLGGPGATPTPTGAIAPTTPAASSPASAATTAPGSPSPTAVPTAGTPGTLVADRTEVLLPRRYATLVGSGGSLSAYRGMSAVGTRLLVASVPADEGFWVTDPDDPSGDPVWVQLTGPPPESPYDVDKGDTVSFTGRFVGHGAGFAKWTGVTAAEGSARLTAQKVHVHVDKQALDLYPVVPG